MKLADSRPPINNTHKVAKKQWAKWNRKAQMTFNSTYSWIRSNQMLFNHPDMPIIPENQWKTIAWNAAWISADCTMNKWWGNTGDGSGKPEVDVSIIYPAHLEKVRAN